MIDRSSIRKTVRAQRRALTAKQRLVLSDALAWQVTRTRWFRSAKHIAAYLASDGEIDPRGIIETAWALGKTVYLPVLLPVGVNRLWFAPVDAHTPLKPNRFGILEPANAAHTRVHPMRLDVTLTPLVAFDDQGNRLGMGGGFYDRSFHYLLRHKHWRRPHLIGLAYEFQQQDRLPHADWDVPLSGIVTNETVLRFRN